MDQSSSKETKWLSRPVYNVRMEVQFISDLAKFPYRKRQTDAGYDIYSIEEIFLPPNRSTIVHTGIKIACPPGFYYTIDGRSSLWRKGVFPNRGIIDSTFTDEIIVSLVNVNGEPYKVEIGDRIAQIILHKQYDADFVVVEEFSREYQQRGTAGFGSSGK